MSSQQGGIKPCLLLLLLNLLLHFCSAFYLPGVAPNDYADGDNVPLYVNSLVPMSNQGVRTLLAYDYYDKRFHFCQPEGGPEPRPESLGSVLFGDRIYTSAFQLNMGKNVECQLLCQTPAIPKDDAQYINQCIDDGYGLNFVVDELPAARIMTDEHTDEEYYSIGFKLGEATETDRPLLNNHYSINIDYHERPDGKKRVVGVVVVPESRDTKVDANGNPDCAHARSGFSLKEDGSDHVVYTYSVTWRASSKAWATRWDNYLHINDPSIHWFSLVNSIVIVLFLTGMVAMILLRALHKDISRYNSDEAQEDLQEDYGWKLVHGDVFRPPHHSMLLSVMVGSGTQLVAMATLTLVFAVLGFLSPSNRGALATVMVIFFMIFGFIGGFVSARVYKMNKGEKWKSNILLSATLLPGVILSTLFTLDLILVASRSSGAVPFGTMMALLAMWLLIFVPLSVMGSYFGFRKSRIEPPVRTNQIPRQIPEQPFYLRSTPSIFMGGILPFGAIFIELYFIMNSIWFHRIYYGIGFLFLVFIVLILTASQVTILLCYFHLCAEDYRWAWRAFLTGAAAGFYVFLYSVLYYLTKLDINSFTSTILYFGYSGIISLLFGLLSGAVGYFACLVFLHRIFASIKVD